MSGRNGLSQRIVEWVTANPGHLGRDIGSALGFKHGSGLLTYMVQTALLWRSGPIKFGRYYADQAQADANHAQLCAEAVARLLSKKRAGWHRSNQRLRVIRSVAGPGVTVLRSVRVTVAPTPPPRYAPAPGFERVITGDWAAKHAERLT